MVHFDVQGVVAPPWDIGICVRPINVTRHKAFRDNKKLAQWIEYYRMMGADQIYLYHSHITTSNRKLLDIYENETLNLLHDVDWTEVESQVELAVSDEAAVNHCLYSNMMKNIYLLIISFDEMLVFGETYKNLKQLVRSNYFKEQIHRSGGFRIFTPSHKVNDLVRHTMLIKAQSILATAANHFVPISGRPYFRILDATDVISVPHSQFMKISIPYHKAIITAMNKATTSRLKLAKH